MSERRSDSSLKPADAHEVSTEKLQALRAAMRATHLPRIVDAVATVLFGFLLAGTQVLTSAWCAVACLVSLIGAVVAWGWKREMERRSSLAETEFTRAILDESLALRAENASLLKLLMRSNGLRVVTKDSPPQGAA